MKDENGGELLCLSEEASKYKKRNIPGTSMERGHCKFKMITIEGAGRDRRESVEKRGRNFITVGNGGVMGETSSKGNPMKTIGIKVNHKHQGEKWRKKERVGLKSRLGK